MRYDAVAEGRFVRRMNRFVALVRVGGRTMEAHVRNTGRFAELLLPDARIFLEDHGEAPAGKRKTRYTLIGVASGGAIVNIDSGASNRLVGEALEHGRLPLPGLREPWRTIRPETGYGTSRFDFFLEDAAGRKAFLEVKTVTLLDQGVARFPDAPTLRGIRHLQELERAVAEGFAGIVLFVVQAGDVRAVEPNDRTHMAFGVALRAAIASGVTARAVACRVGPDSIELAAPVPVGLWYTDTI